VDLANYASDPMVLVTWQTMPRVGVDLANYAAGREGGRTVMGLMAMVSPGVERVCVVGLFRLITC